MGFTPRHAPHSRVCFSLFSVVSFLGSRIPRRVAKLWVKATRSALCKGVMSVSAALPSSPPNSAASPDRPSEITARKCRSPRSYCTPKQISLQQSDIKTFFCLFVYEKESKNLEPLRHGNLKNVAIFQQAMV